MNSFNPSLRPSYSPHVSTRTLCRAYSVKPSETYQSVEEAIADYDKSPSAGLAGFLLIPTVGLSLLAYIAHHSARTQEKIDGNYALASEIISAPTISLGWSREQLKAGGFIFSDVLYEEEARLLVRKDAIHFSSVIDRLEKPGQLQEENDSQCESELDLSLKWERAIYRWASWGQDPALLFPGNLTVKDIKFRAANYIRTKAEEEARCYIQTHMIVASEVEADLIHMAGIYAVAKASVPPDPDAGEEPDPDEIKLCLRENSEALNSLRNIFGIWEPDSKKDTAYREMIRTSVQIDRSKASDEQKKYDLQKKGLIKAVDCCFGALKDNYLLNSHDYVVIDLNRK